MIDDMPGAGRQRSPSNEEAALVPFTCPVCYEEYCMVESVALECKHRFCFECVKQHITVAITSGSAVRISCMEQGCPEKYLEDDIKPFVSEDLLTVY